VSAGIFFVLAGAVSLPPPAQTFESGIFTVSPEQCVWRTGDNPEWAAASLDESGWLPFSAWEFNVAEPRVWVRCHIDSAAFPEPGSPEAQVRIGAAYEVFLNGASIARNGNVESGNFSMNLIRVFPLAVHAREAGSNLG